MALFLAVWSVFLQLVIIAVLRLSPAKRSTSVPNVAFPYRHGWWIPGIPAWRDKGKGTKVDLCFHTGIATALFRNSGFHLHQRFFSSPAEASRRTIPTWNNACCFLSRGTWTSGNNIKHCKGSWRTRIPRMAYWRIDMPHVSQQYCFLQTIHLSALHPIHLLWNPHEQGDRGWRMASKVALHSIHR